VTMGVLRSNALPNHGPNTPILYYVFDVMLLAGRDVTAETLDARRELLERSVLPKLDEPVRYAGDLKASLRDLIHSVTTQRLEGLVAKRRDSKYEPGLRTGAWLKMRIHQGQAFRRGRAKLTRALLWGEVDARRSQASGCPRLSKIRIPASSVSGLVLRACQRAHIRRHESRRACLSPIASQQLRREPNA
jgi:ATP dependent DNA ligase domain